jgi:hypothetical protein
VLAWLRSRVSSLRIDSRRLLGPIGHAPPAEYEEAYHNRLTAQTAFTAVIMMPQGEVAIRGQQRERAEGAETDRARPAGTPDQERVTYILDGMEVTPSACRTPSSPAPPTSAA